MSLAYLVAVSLTVHGQQSQADGPRYANGTSLERPTDYREWTFIGSGLGLTYEAETASSAAAPTFTSAFEA